MGEQIFVDDLIILSKKELIEMDINNHVKQFIPSTNEDEQDIREILPQIEEKDIKKAEDYENEEKNRITFLRSYNAFKNISRITAKEKNVLNQDPYLSFEGDTLPDDTLLISISIYHPVKGYKTQEWILLSTMTLQSLKDCIYCLSDFITFNTTNAPVTFTIEGKNLNLNTKLEDLIITIGKPYIYKHRLQCQHFMIFNDIKLISLEDPQYRSAYPYQKFCAKTKRQICEICQNFHAKFVCVNDIMLDKSICYMCETCFRDLHYSENGERLYQDFEVYPYIHD